MNALTTPVLALAMAVCTSPATHTPPPGPPPTDATIIRVIDGDTVVIDDHEHVRIKGLNTPETVKPNTPVQCGGPEASAHAKQVLTGRRVHLITDRGDLYDRWGRLVAEVWLPDGHSYALDAVAAGYGRAYLFNRRHPASNWPAIAAAEQQARAQHLGMWRCP